MNYKIKYLKDTLLEVLYPNRCLLCDEVLPFGNKEFFCNQCISKVKWITGKVCQKCGKPVKDQSQFDFQKQILCFDCSKKRHYFDQGYAMYLYQDEVKEAIHRYKYGNRKGYGKAFGYELGRFYQKNVKWHIDLITSVPLHTDRFKERMFNQSAIIADILSECVRIPVNNHLLVRVKNTLPQKDLTDVERIHNVTDAFEFNKKYACKGKNVLIIDDIYTTGNTMDHCAKTLKNNGVDKVYFLTLAIGKGL